MAEHRHRSVLSSVFEVHSSTGLVSIQQRFVIDVDCGAASIGYDFNFLLTLPIVDYYSLSYFYMNVCMSV